jgi:hypothetical protein
MSKNSGFAIDASKNSKITPERIAYWRLKSEDRDRYFYLIFSEHKQA